MTDKLALAEQIERLEDANFDRTEVRVLNEAVLLAVGWRQDGKDIIDPNGTVRMQAPPVLASLDAAMTLVPEGWGRIEYGRYEDTPDRYWAQISGFDKLAASENCATPALALCAAALRAGGTDAE